jgi:hypothetical protein
MGRLKADEKSFTERGRRIFDAMKRFCERYPDRVPSKSAKSGRPGTFMEGDGPSINKFADEIGISGGALSRHLRGQRGNAVAPETVFDLAKLLEEEAEYLWLGRGPRVRRTCLDDAVNGLLMTKMITKDTAAEARNTPRLYELSVEDAREAVFKIQEAQNRAMSAAAHERDLRDAANQDAARKIKAAKKRKNAAESKPPDDVSPPPASAKPRSRRQTGT